MQSVLRNMTYVISAIFIFYGVMDIAYQLESGSPIDWGFLMIIFGIGMGPPLFLYFNPDIFSPESDSSEILDTMQEDNDDKDNL